MILWACGLLVSNTESDQRPEGEAEGDGEEVVGGVGAHVRPARR